MTIRIRTDDVVVISGKRRSGKSVFLKHLIKGVRRRIIWDYNHEHTSKGFVVHYAHMIKEEWLRGITHIVFQPFDKSEDSFKFFLKNVYVFNNFVLIIEEVERYAYSHHIPLPLRKFIDTGRHKGIGVYVTIRRPARTHKDILSNADHIFMFHQHLHTDIDYLKEWVGEKAETIKDLAPYNFLHFDDRTGKTVQREKVRYSL